MKQKVQYVIALFLCCLLFGGALPVQAAEQQGRLSNKSDIRDLIQFQPTVTERYTFSVNKAKQLCIYNEEKTDTGVVYMEYEVGEVIEDTTYQVGFFATNDIQARITNSSAPRSTYLTNFKKEEPNPLFVPGAKYYVCFVTRDNCFEYYAQRTVDGNTERISVTTEYGKWQEGLGHFSLWLGEGTDCWLTGTVKNFKCYDVNGKDLGVAVAHNASYTYEPVYKVGQEQNYGLCEGAYYCSEKPELGLIVLGQDKKGYCQLAEGKTDFSYFIQNNGNEISTLYLAFPDGKQAFNYQYIQIIDDAGNIFEKLRNYKVTFVNGEETTTEMVGVEQVYRLQEPENPKRKGATFAGWYLGNDEAFDFNSVISESITLYAKWDGDATQTFTSLEEPEVRNINIPMIIAIGSSVVILSGCIVLGVWILRRKKHV